MPAATKNAPAKDQKATAGFTAVESGKKERKEKKPKVKRTAFGDRDEKGKLKEKIKGAVTPEGFDSKLHLPLRKQDYDNPADFLNVTADRLEAKAKKLRQQAIDEAKLGNVSDRKKAKRMKSLHDKFKALFGEMKGSGMSEEALKAFLEGGEVK